ncbi:hypothetical protein ACIKP7_01400 [Pseudomonas caricapapayae]|uniref:Uncharacterized protein n=1 Tax=Pseudomonas caricapapayae TaxID=46678 RepID=A0ACC7LPL0_9PSED
MSHQFKPGDLAIITCGVNAGCCVTLISHHNSGRVILKNGLFTDAKPGEWRVEGQNLVARIGMRSKPERVPDGLIEEKYLMPIQGDFAPEQQKAKEAEPCL